MIKPIRRFLALLVCLSILSLQGLPGTEALEAAAASERSINAEAARETASAAFTSSLAKHNIQMAELEVSLELVAEGFRLPVDLVPSPEKNGGLYILDQAGRVYHTGTSIEAPLELFLNLQDRLEGQVKVSGLRLHALAFDAEYEQNRRFYVYYTVRLGEDDRPDWKIAGRLSEFSASSGTPGLVDVTGERVLLEVDRPHYVMERILLGRDASDLLVLRILPDGNERKEAVFCFDRERLRAGCPDDLLLESKQFIHQEVASLLKASTKPEYALVGGIVYQGMAFPSLQGKTLFVGWKHAGQKIETRLFAAETGRHPGLPGRVQEIAYHERAGSELETAVVSLEQDASGELYLLTAGDPAEDKTGKVFKIVPLIQAVHHTIDRPQEYLPLEYRYGRVVREVPVYRTLEDVRMKQPSGTHGGGNYWVSERGLTKVDGELYYQVAWGWGNRAWIAARHVLFDAPLSHLRGVRLHYRAGEPLAMTYRSVHVRPKPGVINDESPVGILQPYDLVTVTSFREVNGAVWYQIGPDQWVHGHYLRALVPSPRPEDVGAGEKWVEVNLSQQVVIAHEGDQPVFVTLASTGRVGYETKKGLFRTWSVLRDGPMRWEESRHPYNLANVPYIMYFNQGQGLHGAYWHDLFGGVRSAGCVNLSPHDAAWMFQWAGLEPEPDERIRYIGEDEPGLWVWVHNRAPNLEALIHAYNWNIILEKDAPASLH
jgi:hypothetical protein